MDANEEVALKKKFSTEAEQIAYLKGHNEGYLRGWRDGCVFKDLEYSNKEKT